MNIAGALAEGAAAGLERLDAQLLLLWALGREQTDRAWLLAHDTDELADEARGRFSGGCERRLGGEPLAYIVGTKEFFGLELAVDPRVLVPRPDTETVVEWSGEVLAGRDHPRVVDLGTGSGAIALAIKKMRPDADVDAIDASSDALKVARANAQRLALDVRFMQGSWLDDASGSYDLIVSNPPYVAEHDPHLAALRHEPLQALASGPLGLNDLRIIIAQASRFLRQDGYVLLEHGWDQGPAVRALLQTAGFAEIETRKDLGGAERCSGGKRLEQG